MSIGFAYAYEHCFTGENLTKWRGFNTDQQDKIITEANNRWNTRAKAKVDELNKK